ncbi:MAG: glycoside hydrolase [Arcobacter sp.]|nr:MAG: glycoside hydrolase [Arcobacter sp.]
MTNMDDLVIGIKEHEGFRGKVYEDHLGFPTVGYGTKMPLTKKEATVLLRLRLTEMVEELFMKRSIFRRLPVEAQNILAEMAYQMGVPNLMKFRKTWAFLEEHEFIEASIEMLDSQWHKQTPSRAKELSKRMKQIKTQG